MERRKIGRVQNAENGLMLKFGALSIANIIDYNSYGLRFRLLENQILEVDEAFIMYSEVMNPIHGKIVWSRLGTVGAKIMNPRSASAGSSIVLRGSLMEEI